jgi:outer membrane usher protein
VGREVARSRLALSALTTATLALALASSPVRAESEPQTIVIEVKDPQVRVRAELDLFINQAPGGTLFVVLEKGDCLVQRRDLEAAGLAVRGGQQILVDEIPLLSLRSLAPTITFEVDEPGLALRITAPPELLGRRTLDLRPRLRPADFELRSDPSAFMDYAVDADTAGRIGLAFEAGGRVERWLATTGLTGDAKGVWTRGLTSAVRDDVPAMERWTLGDGASVAGPLGGSVLLGGISFAREFSLDPYFVHGSFPSATAVINTPSTMEVYVNGALVRQQSVAPGFWDLSNIPAQSGQTLVQTVVRDAFGRERTIDNSFYYSSGVLTPGLSDYAFAGGFRREEFGRSSLSYGRPAALARYRVGLLDWFTPGGRAEAALGLLSVGGTGTFALPWGEIEGAVGFSGAHGEAGTAAQVSWLWMTRRYSWGLRFAAQSDRYANLSLEPSADRPLFDAEASAGTSISRRLSLSTDLRVGWWRDAGQWGTGALRGSVALGKGASLVLSGEYGKLAGGERGVQLMALLIWSFAPRYSADASTTRRRDGKVEGAISTTRSIAQATGVGYRLRGAGMEGSDPSLDAVLQGQNSFGRAEVQLSHTAGVSQGRANASGGLVFVDRGFYFSRPTDGSFALVQAGGVPGIAVSKENNEVGRTGADGKLLVTGLQPYYATRLSLRDRDVPLEYDAGKTERLIGAPLRGGAIVAFDLKRISAITGQLGVMMDGELQRPGNGELSVIIEGELRTSPVTPDGRFFLERIPPGKHVMQAVWRAGSCRASITLPRGAPVIFDAGEVRCYLDTLDPEGKIPRLDDPAYADRPLPGEGTVGAGGGGGGDAK